MTETKPQLSRTAISRLTKLADHLDSVDRATFDLKEWHAANCTTVACAVGHACSIPAFIRAGLKLEFSYVQDSITLSYPRFRYTSGWYAVEVFFDINCNQAKYLFEAERYHEKLRKSPKTVVRRIRAFIRSGGVVRDTD